VNRMKAGLAVAFVIGIAVALFPLYSDYLSPILWSEAEDAGEEEEDVYAMTGIVESVIPEEEIIIVNGKEIMVKGYWYEEDDNTTTLYAADVIAMIQPGMKVTVEYTESGRWGAIAEKIVIHDLGVTLVKEEA